VPDRPPEAPRRRRRWGRWTLVAVCAIGAVAVILIATTRPTWIYGPREPEFTLESIAVGFTGSGAGAVSATSICGGHCPVRLSVGTTQLLAFTVTPSTPIGNCSPSTHFTVTKVVESSTTGAFPVDSVSADVHHTALPVTIPNPLGGSTCVTTAQIWVTFGVVDQGPSTQTPSLKVTVTES